ncbi:tyrosine-type recombinase/integrase [uncultured Roseobacter sp.]|uniref:site-specific integrase n=1 Tax=uncultured Roseobacter sp. TaxID=114847 RepID=UPI002603E620|nr:tyrosine-type recombinase/integrase [uncultured Roseobacter sp.]
MRLIAPEVLVGTENPWTGKPFGREIKLGLNTRSHAEAVRLRDIRLGQIRQLEAEALAARGRKSVGRIIDLSPESAAEWRQIREEAQDPDSIDHVLTDELERADKAGLGQEVQTFAGIVFRGAVPLRQALEEYLHDRREGNPQGFDALSTTTALDVRATVNHLLRFFGDTEPTLNDVTREKAFEFRAQYLPVQRGLKPQTVAKHVTFLRGLWKWAIADKRYLKTKNGRPARNPWIVEEIGTPRKRAGRGKADKKREAFTPEQVDKLLGGFSKWGSRQGDLMRLVLVTGCRVDEVGSLLLDDVAEGGSSFIIRQGKTENAARTVPLVENAQRLLAERMASSLQAQQQLEANKSKPDKYRGKKPSYNREALERVQTMAAESRVKAQYD